jgi:hypothetical protein
MHGGRSAHYNNGLGCANGFKIKLLGDQRHHEA